MHLPTHTHIDKRLIGGSLLFGAGWGIAGICPGPALVLLGSLGSNSTNSIKSLIFFVAMLAGMQIYKALQKLTVTMAHAA